MFSNNGRFYERRRFIFYRFIISRCDNSCHLCSLGSSMSVMGKIIAFRRGCRYSADGSCIAKTPRACVCPFVSEVERRFGLPRGAVTVMPPLTAEDKG
jgi:hypothetical protein